MAISKRGMSLLIHEAKHFILGARKWASLKAELQRLENRNGAHNNRNRHQHRRYEELLNLLSVEELKRVSPRICDSFALSTLQERRRRQNQRELQQTVAVSGEDEDDGDISSTDNDRLHHHHHRCISPSVPSSPSTTTTIDSDSTIDWDTFPLAVDKRPSSKRLRKGQRRLKISFSMKNNSTFTYSRFWRRKDFKCGTDFPLSIAEEREEYRKSLEWRSSSDASYTTSIDDANDAATIDDEDGDIDEDTNSSYSEQHARMSLSAPAPAATKSFTSSASSWLGWLRSVYHQPCSVCIRTDTNTFEQIR